MLPIHSSRHSRSILPEGASGRNNNPCLSNQCRHRLPVQAIRRDDPNTFLSLSKLGGDLLVQLLGRCEMRPKRSYLQLALVAPRNGPYKLARVGFRHVFGDQLPCVACSPLHDIRGQKRKHIVPSPPRRTACWTPFFLVKGNQVTR
jgi:hypothetical protein